MQVPDAVPEGVEALFQPQETSRMYNPYAGLQTIDPRQQQQQRQFRISTQPEFVFQEEASHKRRSGSENLGYYTGAGYVGGAVVGGTVGMAQGIMFRPEITTSSRRLMINRLLNTTGQTGRLAGAHPRIHHIFTSGSPVLMSTLPLQHTASESTRIWSIGR